MLIMQLISYIIYQIICNIVTYIKLYVTINMYHCGNGVGSEFLSKKSGYEFVTQSRTTHDM